MATKESVYEMAIKQKGYWGFSDTYAFLYDWLKQKSYNLSEESYEESSGSAKEIKIAWKASKKVTDYFKYQITLDWHILGMKDAEVEIDGKVQKTNKGDLKIKVQATFIRDYDSDWTSKPFHRILRGIYEKYIIASHVKEYAGGLEDEATAMIEDLKAFLRMAQ